MKKLFFALVAALLMAGSSVTMNAQISKEARKEREEIRKTAKAELSEKASKDARNEAKRLKKEGYIPSPGALPIEKQLDRSFVMQSEYDEDLMPKYFNGRGMSVGESYDAAKFQALEMAKMELTSQIQTEITALIDNSLANQQLSGQDAASVAKSVAAGKSLISQSLGRLIVVVEYYRTLKNGNKEVVVQAFYNGSQAKQAAKKAVYENLEDDNKELHDTLDKILGW